MLSLSFLLLRVHEVHAAVVRGPGAVPRQTGLGVDRTVGLRRDEVEAADMRRGDEDAVAKPGRAEAIRIDVDEQLAAALPRLGERAHLHYLPVGADRHVSVGAVVRSRDGCAGVERADPTETADCRAGGEHRAAGVEHQPHLTFGRR